MKFVLPSSVGLLKDFSLAASLWIESDPDKACAIGVGTYSSDSSCVKGDGERYSPLTRVENYLWQIFTLCFPTNFIV